MNTFQMNPKAIFTDMAFHHPPKAICADMDFHHPQAFSTEILAQAIACSNVRGVFPDHELFWFCRVQVSTIQFFSFPPVFMACFDDGSEVMPISPEPGTFSNHGSPDGSTPDHEGTGPRPSITEEKINEMFPQFAQLPLLLQSVCRFENCV